MQAGESGPYAKRRGSLFPHSLLIWRSFFPWVRLPGENAELVVSGELLTGGRETEVLGLELNDVSLDRRTVTFRPNPWRRLKTPGSHRVVRLWPQLAEILGSYLAWRTVERGGRLLFPSPWSAEEQMISDLRKLLDRVALRAGLQKGEIRTKVFRHTYCAARLQTLDQGAPVSTYTVARELGHESEAMVRRVYAHLGTIRHRSEVVEFRVEQHLDRLGDRLRRLGLVQPSGTGNDTTLLADPDTKKPHNHGSDSRANDSDEWAWVELNYRPHAYQPTRLEPEFRLNTSFPTTSRAICPELPLQIPESARLNGHHNGHRCYRMAPRTPARRLDRYASSQSALS